MNLRNATDPGPMQHDLKCWPELFDPVADGRKPFDVRRGDRDFEQGDVVRVLEWDPATETYTGRDLIRLITYVFRADSYRLADGSTAIPGVEPGHVVLGFGSPDTTTATPTHPDTSLLFITLPRVRSLVHLADMPRLIQEGVTATWCTGDVTGGLWSYRPAGKSCPLCAVHAVEWLNPRDDDTPEHQDHAQPPLKGCDDHGDVHVRHRVRSQSAGRPGSVRRQLFLLVSPPARHTRCARG